MKSLFAIAIAIAAIGFWFRWKKSKPWISGFDASFEGKDVTTPDSVSDIGDRDKHTCLTLRACPRSIAFSPAVRYIQSCAFQNASRLESITFSSPFSLEIADKAFYNCTALKSVSFARIRSISQNAFWGCSAIDSVRAEPRWSKYFPSARKWIIPDYMTDIIMPVSFSDCPSLTSITIGAGLSSVKGIPRNVQEFHVSGNSKTFSEIDGVLFSKDGKTIIGFPQKRTGSYSIPDGVTTIGDHAFANCSGLTSITIPDSVTSIGISAFWECSRLTSIAIPGSVVNIGLYAFYKCSGLTSITISDGVTSIESEAFNGCSGLTSITIPDSVTRIGGSAFYNCSGLMSITWPKRLIASDYSEFDGRRLELSDNVIWTLSDAATRIGAYAMVRRKVQAIPPSVKEVGEYAFRASSFNILHVPKSLEIVKNGAFFFADLSKHNLDIPVSLKEVGPGAFWTSDPPKTVNLGPGTLAWNFTEHSPFAAKESFVVDAGNGTFSARDGVLFSKDGTILVSVPQGLSGDFAIPDGVTKIAPAAFRNCRLLRSIRIPPTLKTIGFRAFEDNHSLVNCVIPQSVVNLGTNAFLDCRSLERIRLPQNVSVADGAFWNCFQLVTAEFDATVKFVGNPFFGCERLSQEARDRFRAYTGQYPVIAKGS